MATSLAAQLKQIAAKSKSTLNVKAQKAAHSKSLIWEARVAASQSYDTLYSICRQGFEELCLLDSRFTHFESTIFSEESQHQDRTQLTAAENGELDRQIEAFLRLAGSRLRLMPAIKAIEWLIRRFKIHEENTEVLLTTFLPYHSIPTFATLLSILPQSVPHNYRFLAPYIKSLTCPSRAILVHQAIHHPEFLTAISDYTLQSCKAHYQYPALISFWGGLMTEAVSGLVDRARSGRAAIQAENNQTLLHRLGPIFAESLVLKKVPSLQIASYMAIAVYVSKGNLEDVAVTAFMEQTVYGWTNDTVRPALVCLSILAQHRSAKQMSNKVTKALMKVEDVGSILVEIGKERRVDKLANGLCLALVDRLTKKSDARGLPTILAILSSQTLKEKQIAVIFKSMILTALRLDDNNDEDGALRRELGSTLISLSQISGKSGDIIHSVLQEVDFDIEELELKLDLSFRSRRLPEADKDDTVMTNSLEGVKPSQDLDAVISDLAAQAEPLPSCLLPEPKEIFAEFSHLFLSIVTAQAGNPGLLFRFSECPQLHRQQAFADGTYCSFFIRIWCGTYPALARVAAIDMVKSRLSSEDGSTADVQALIPYCIVALSDPSKRVRQAAADLITVLGNKYSSPGSTASLKDWGSGILYGGLKDVASLSPELTARFLHLHILPSLEECVMDPDHISEMLRAAIEHGKYLVSPPPALDKRDHMSQAGRLALLTFLADHVVHTPLLLVKDRLLRSLNNIRGVSGTTRTQLLLPVLKWWAELSEDEVAERSRAEAVDREALDSQFVQVVVPSDVAGLNHLLAILGNSSAARRTGLVGAIFAHLEKIWTSMKDEVKFEIAQQLLEMSQSAGTAQNTDSIVPTEAAAFLRVVPLTTDILSYFLDSIHTGTKIITEPPPNKRRRTSSSEIARGVTEVTPALSQALRRITFVLQLVDSSNPLSHPELLDGLFTALSELQHFRTVVGSELGYLQNLILRSLLAMMPAYQKNKNLPIDSSGGYGDLLANCVQRSSSPVVQNAALLLIASLATTAPNVVLHSVMPIFTFMGTSVLRQSDDYSAHVVSQTIQEVIPPLIESLRQGQKSPVAGASDILLSFTTAYEHVPSHRRQSLFLALVETLGAREFLFALIGMMVDRYGPSDALLQFIIDLMGHFNAEIQIETLVKLLSLTSDLFETKPGISFILLGINEEGGKKDAVQIAQRQLAALPSFLTGKKLKKQIQELAGRDDMEASAVRGLYATLLENILTLSHKVKDSKELHDRCGASLASLLYLLSIDEFIQAVESLLDRPDMGLRQRVLRALEIRVDSESKGDAASRTALLAFLPQLTAAIRESTDIRYKHTAVTCVDKIAEKYGKKDIEAVVAAALTIASEHCLGQDEQRLRVMALLCLTSLVDVLRDAIVPVLPLAIPKALAYLNSSLDNDIDEELHAASYGLLASLADHLPYMLSSSMDHILEVSHRSAQAELEEDAVESRVSCLEVLARRLDAKDIFSSLEKGWRNATTAGFSAMAEHLDVLGIAIDKHPKSSITKNARVLSSLFTQAFDLRRQAHAKGVEDGDISGQVAQTEASINDKALKMIYKLNDAAFRPIFIEFIEWMNAGLPQSDKTGKVLRQQSVFSFLHTFFGTLKSIVTNYAGYIVEEAVKILNSVDPTVAEEERLWRLILGTLSKCFEHDQDDFWQAPSHFGPISAAVLQQFLHAPKVDVDEDLIPATVELAAAADSQAHQKELNSGLLKHLRSEQASVRLAAIKCEQALTDRLGEEWLSMLHEMLPRISELQDDDDEVVETETHRWIVKIEGVLGESLDAMLQ
ncbi:hypothetical protein S7711_09348 [Stachybotrys chartarum IBT 7711]|uniref:U3 small nucleolar RNA-associated protein 10 n=1 Tax=Stachybotrys chartarum (strain CBS 109288 / IBT 7711) TaxID=1280523 RepID=A0A084AIU2_STACB|nr:hypothetical protein S7711_09348 [Stachybotrys chartarum IBT 7711]